MTRTEGNLARADLTEDFAFGEPATALDLVLGEMASIAEVLDAGRPEDAPSLPLATVRLLALVVVLTALVGASVAMPTMWVVSRLLGPS